MLKIWWLKLPKTLKCSKSNGWRSLKRWRTQNLMVEITENMEQRKIWWLKSPKTLKYAKSNGWSGHKTLKHAKSDGWIGLKQWSAQNLIGCLKLNYSKFAVEDEECKIWWLKLPVTLKCSKSDGWRSLKRWRTKNLMVEVS